MKILTLVMSGSDADRNYDGVVTACKSTWAGGPDVLFYRGGGSGAAVEADQDLILPIEECTAAMGREQIMAFEHVLATREFDYVVKCCSGSYVHLGNLRRHLEDKPRTGFYSGMQGDFDGVKYASGSFAVLSRDVVAAAVASQAKVKNWVECDDVLLGRLLQAQGVVHDGTSARRVNGEITDFSQFVVDGLSGPDDPCTDLKNNWHFHMRNHPEVMRAVHAFFGAP